ncbi:MAG: flagellar protein FlgN [Pseudobdellovibrionaceae bacterium]
MSLESRTFTRLEGNLEELIKLYRVLLDTVRKEKEFLIEANAEKIAEINKTKETLLHKIKTYENMRMRYAQEAAAESGADAKAPRLLEIAQKYGGAQGDRLRHIHSTLDLLLKRLTEINRENQQYAEKGLNTLSGALEEVKDTLTGKTGYGKTAVKERGPEKTGNLVSREA